jgi:hypothetical protein
MKKQISSSNKNYENNLEETRIQLLHNIFYKNQKVTHSTCKHKRFNIVVVVKHPKISSQEKERTRPALMKGF